MAKIQGLPALVFSFCKRLRRNHKISKINMKKLMEGRENREKLHLKTGPIHSILDVTVKSIPEDNWSRRKDAYIPRNFSREHPFDGI